MLKKTITFIDYDGNKRTEDHYFNLSKAEVIEMELGESGGLSKTLEKIVAEQDNVKLMKYFKSIILKSYGEKTADGRRFIKSPELSEAFTQTEAYSELFMELMDSEKMAEFVNGIIPNTESDKPMISDTVKPSAI